MGISRIGQFRTPLRLFAPGAPAPSIAVATPATPTTSPVKTAEMGRSLIPVATIEQYKEQQAVSIAPPKQGLSTNMMIGLGAAAALAGFYWWKHR